MLCAQHTYGPELSNCKDRFLVQVCRCRAYVRGSGSLQLHRTYFLFGSRSDALKDTRARHRIHCTVCNQGPRLWHAVPSARGVVCWKTRLSSHDPESSLLPQALPIVAGQQPDTHLFKLQKYRVQDTKVKVTVVRRPA